MKIRSLLLAALAVASFNAQAALTTYAPFAAQYPGLAGVQFNVNGNAGATVAMGAHPYIYGQTMPNDGVSTYYAKSGLSNPLRANWSFDFAWDMSACQTCQVHLFVDTDPTAGFNMVELKGIQAHGADSWNMEMSFMQAALEGYNFDPFSPSSTIFSLVMTDDGAEVARSDITVNVPEPGSMALLGLGLAALGATARRRSKK